MPFTVEPMLSEQTQIRVHLVLTSTIGTFECVWTWFASLCFQTWWVHLLIGFATPTKFTMILWFIWSITFDAFRSLDSAQKCGVFPFPTIFTLWNSGVHVSSSYCSNIPSYVETLINQALSSTPALNVPDVDPNDWHVWLWQHFNDMWLGSKCNVVKDLILLNNFLNVTRCKLTLRVAMREIWDAYYL